MSSINQNQPLELDGDLYLIKGHGIHAYFVVVDRKIVMAHPCIKELKGNDGKFVQEWALKNNCEIKKQFTQL